MADGMTFRVEPRHVTMFGARGILAPLYQRQAAQTALAERERRQQAQFEQAKALTELRARLQEQIRAPLQEAQIERLGTQQELAEFQLGELQQQRDVRQEFEPLILDARRKGDRAEEGRLYREYMFRLTGELPQEQQQRERIWYNPETGRMERTTAVGVDYGPAALRQMDQQPAPDMPMTWKDRQALDDQVRQRVGGFGQEKLRSPVLKRLGIKQAGTIDNYLSKFMGGREWEPGQLDEFGKILQYMSDPANAGVIGKDKQIQTIMSGLRELQIGYDPVWRDQMLRLQGAAPTGAQLPGGATGWEQFLQGGAADVQAAQQAQQMADSLRAREQMQSQWQGMFAPPFR